jgi:hypothetical protein
LNNDFNAKEAQKARDFILDMWNKTNEYNSASAQRDRWQQAGFNPYMMNSSGSAGAAQAVSGSAQASAVSNPTAQAYRYDFSVIIVTVIPIDSIISLNITLSSS